MGERIFRGLRLASFLSFVQLHHVNMESNRNDKLNEERLKHISRNVKSFLPQGDEDDDQTK
jgi:hypothetical protein